MPAQTKAALKDSVAYDNLRRANAIKADTEQSAPQASTQRMCGVPECAATMPAAKSAAKQSSGCELNDAW